MQVLVTGGAGFIGSHLSEKLLRRGDFVVVVDNFNDYYDPGIKEKNVIKAKDYSNYSLHKIDILDFDALKSVFDAFRFDAIIHLAARAGVRPSLKNPLLYQDVNIKGTMNLLELTRDYRIPKFIFASSSSVYGSNKKVPFSEHDNVDYPVSPYAATKKAAELLGFTYYHLYGFTFTAIRFFTVYGPRQRPDMAIHKFTALIDEGEAIPVFGDGQSKRDYTYIDDILDGVLKAVEKSEGYNIYNLGDSRTIGLLEMIHTIETHLGKKAKIKWLPFQPGDVPITYADISKARTELGYEPVVLFTEGVKKFMDWYKQF
ncbi:UDP-glucose 4-epimerase [bacterium BMS3Abin05]|nr:UDP-glucose 4-epimerase [bacterium BMS3Abin05]HDL78225.1 NAD-dependent epimerase/dehydratase family protein [Bacteroidota bacterium]HDZ12922.1 NAD-dependent epimerase/dehydratase family protein [Bacteroidota bacterium]